jgi:multidrug efflux pump subunit AcrB
MQLAEYAIRHSRFAFVVCACFAALGLASFLAIPRLEDPHLEVPFFSVVAVYPGASATDIEQLIARPLEDAFKELDDINKIQATVRDGFASISVEFFYGTDPEKKYDDVLRQVNVKRPALPSGVVEIDVRKVQTINVASLQVALVSKDASYGRLQDVAEDLRRDFENVPGVRQARLHAFPLKQVRVSLDLERMAELRVSLGQVVSAIQGANLTLPGGSVELENRRFNVKTSGHYESIEEVKRTPIASNGTSIIYLEDIGEVEWTTADHEEMGRFNGERAMFVSVRPQEAQNLFKMNAHLREVAESFSKALPGDILLEVGWDQSENIARRLGSLERDFLIAVGLVLLTVLPLGLRASALVVVSIPLSLALGITALYYSGFTLNQLSIVGCVIALGLLVDDSIVVVENIARFRRMGYNAKAAAIAGTKQIAVAVIGTTFTLLFGFFPLLMVPGGPGQYMRSLPLTVVYTVFASMIVALGVVPLLSSYMLRGATKEEGNILLRTLQRIISATYRPILHWCMQHRWSTLAGAALLTIASFALMPRVGFSLFPKAGIPQFLVKIEAEEGASVAATDSIARQAEAVLRRHPEVKTTFTTVGNRNPQVYYNEVPQSNKPNIAEIFATLGNYKQNTLPQFFATLRQQMDEIPGARILVKEFENGPVVEAPLVVRLFSDDLESLRVAAARVHGYVDQVEGTHSVENPLRVQRTDIRIWIDRAAAALLGVPEAEIDRAVRLAFGGIDVSRFREADGDEYAIQVALPRGERATLENWQHLRVQSATTGAYIPIAQLADWEFEKSAPIIQRYNRERSVAVTAFVSHGYNVARLNAQIAEGVSQLELPDGVKFKMGGEAETQQETFGGLGGAVLVTLFAIFGILVLEFRSFRGTLIVGSVIPLGILGGIFALWLTGQSLSFTAGIGFVALIGIEIKNSILLVDFTNQLRADGVELKEAIERAGEVRFLPIVLTTLTAVGALLPLCIEGSDLYSPLATVIVGGLISSLVLSRLVTPVLYSLIPPPMPKDLEDGTVQPRAAVRV